VHSSQKGIHHVNNDNTSYDINSAWCKNPELSLKNYSLYSKNEVNVTNSKSNVHLNSTVSFANLNKDIHENTLCSPATSLSMLSP